MRVSQRFRKRVFGVIGGFWSDCFFLYQIRTGGTEEATPPLTVHSCGFQITAGHSLTVEDLSGGIRSAEQHGGR